MSMRLILCIVLFCLCRLTGFSQPTDGLIAYYSFDACDATENTGAGADGIIVGNATCG